MELIAISILVTFALIGFAAIFFTTFGTLIILIGTAIYALLTEFAFLNISTLIILLILYLFGEVFEYACIIIGTKKFGASNAAVAGALVGGIVGALLGTPLFGVGLLAGTFLGIFLGAFLVELVIQQDPVKSLKAGLGGVLGRVGSIFAKVVIAVIMFVIIASSIIKGG